MNKILVINLARFGDIVQSTPMLHGLKIKYPECRLTLMINKQFSYVRPIIPDVDHFVEVDFGRICKLFYSGDTFVEDTYNYFKDFFGNLKEKRFDKIINITPHYAGVYTAMLAGSATSMGTRMSEWQKYYINITRHWKTLSFHVVDLFVKMAGLSQQRIIPKLNVDAAAIKSADQFLKKSGIKKDEMLIGFHTGASKPEKQWPDEFFYEVAEKIIVNLNARIILFGTESESSINNKILNIKEGRVLNASGKTNAVELASLLSRLNIFITNDTGPMHVAAAGGTKVISVHMGKEQ